MSLFTDHIKRNQLDATSNVVTKSHLTVLKDLNVLINIFHCPWKIITGRRKIKDQTILWVIVS